MQQQEAAPVAESHGCGEKTPDVLYGKPEACETGASDGGEKKCSDTTEPRYSPAMSAPVNGGEGYPRYQNGDVPHYMAAGMTEGRPEAQGFAPEMQGHTAPAMSAPVSGGEGYPRYQNGEVPHYMAAGMTEGRPEAQGFAPEMQGTGKPAEIPGNAPDAAPADAHGGKKGGCGCGKGGDHAHPANDPGMFFAPPPPGYVPPGFPPGQIPGQTPGQMPGMPPFPGMFFAPPPPGYAPPGFMPGAAPGPQSYPHPGMPFPPPPGYAAADPGQPSQPQYAPQGDPGHPKHDMWRYGQLMEVVNGIAEGKPDVGQIMTLMQNYDTRFWKGTLIGAVAALVLTSDTVKNTLAGAMGAAWGLFQKDKNDVPATAAGTGTPAE